MDVFLNLTDHPVRLTGPAARTFPPSGKVARVQMSSFECRKVLGVPIFRWSLREATDLPAPSPGVYLIVSVIVRLAFPERHDLLSPGPPTYDAVGNQTSRYLVSNE